MAITKLTSEQLYRKCDAAKFDFTTTADLEERLSALGQDRAICAVELGINIKSRGYNLFCLGPEGTGKTSLVKRILEKEGKQRPTPDDWAYVYNFDEPHKPIAVNFPAGAAAGFAKDMEEFAYAMEHDLPEAVKNELYEEQLSVIREKYQEKRNDYVKVLQKKAKGKKVSLLHMPMGVVVAPMKNGEIISPDVFDTLSDDEKNEIMADLNAMQEEIAQHQDDAPGWEEKQTEEIKKLQEKLVKDAIKKPINDIKQKYRGNKKVAEYLKAVQNYILENIPSFVPNYDQDSKPQTEEEPMAGLLSQLKNQQEEDKYSKFKVNVVVKNVPDSGAPIVLLDHPTQGNLVGKVERIQQFGALITDFTLIKGGALHRANGGFLLIDARKLLLQPYSWDSLKRALASKEIKIEAPSEDTSFSTISLDPQPIPLDVKVVMTGDAELYDLLSERDPDFSDYFKVEADFGMIIDRTDENEVEYAKLIGSLTKKKNLRSLNKQAVARVIEYSSRLADDSEKLTAHVSSIGDLLKEADYWARKSKASQIGKNHVDQAIKSQIYRSDRVNRAMLEQIDKGTILLDVKGERVGQINGLVVYNFTRNSFGKPTRITTQVRLGEFINIEREVAMSGPIHSKGVLILQALIANRFAKRSPLSLSASIVFEQSYGGVDGDSASSTEYYCMLSAIANLPIKQSLAVTGSINQFGEIQPIGGVNEKIEGFFEVCKYNGLTGKQGVIIPRTNVVNLMLREDVLEAVENGQFSIYAIDDVDDGIELLTGIPAGKADKRGRFPKGTVNYMVQQSLEEYYRDYVKFAKETHGAV